jgi:hypothetical protein
VLFLRGRCLCHIYGSDYWRVEEQKVEVICADDAPLENACQTQANLRRWTG